MLSQGFAPQLASMKDLILEDNLFAEIEKSLNENGSPYAKTISKLLANVK